MDWYPREHVRKRGSPPTDWDKEMKKTCEGAAWKRVALERKEWKRMGQTRRLVRRRGEEVRLELAEASGAHTQGQVETAFSGIFQHSSRLRNVTFIAKRINM
ncbi:unnamed protein product [Nezara viridula]|uniref:Uncharacterized protein n=1 Tax=Nezara viridula TaxID=85310 RepID=A0A9P0GZQ9_NEZVI|nr:unnamed protein product [Nezara viridula]